MLKIISANALKQKFFLNLVKNNDITVATEGHAHAHDPGSAIMHVRMNSDLGIFAPMIMRMRMAQENPTKCACAFTRNVIKIEFYVFFCLIINAFNLFIN